MALPDTGEISLGDINVEKGNAETAADTSLQALSTTNINTDSTDRPDEVAPHKVDEFHGYDHNASGEPGTPSNLTATTASSTQIDLSWGDVADEDEYRIERSTDGSSYSQIDTVTAGTTSYSDTGLTEGKQYHYRVRACNTSGCSTYSNTDNATTTLPAPSSLSSPSHDSNSVDLSWVDNSADETGFEIQYKLSTDSWPGTSQTVGANTTSDTVSSLTSDTSYDFRVRAQGEDTDSSWSSEITVTTDALNAPTINSITPDSTSAITIDWDNVSGADHYEVEHSTDGSSWSDEHTTSDQFETDYQDTGLGEASRHYYRVRAVDGSGSTGPWSNTADTFTKPTAPTSQTANADSSTQITTGWNDNSGGESGYKIERESPSGGGFNQIQDVGANTTSYIDGGLNSSTQYCYRTRAYVTHPTHGDIHSSYTTKACATTDSGPV